MDRLDIEILELLKSDARIRAASISNTLHLSVSSVIDRMKKMEKKGIIKNYTTLINEKSVGLDVIAFMEISLEHPNFYESFTEEIKKHPNITECYYLTGDYDFSLKIYCESSEALEQIHRSIKSIKGVLSTKTHFVLKEVKMDTTPELNRIIKNL